MAFTTCSQPSQAHLLHLSDDVLRRTIQLSPRSPRAPDLTAALRRDRRSHVQGIANDPAQGMLSRMKKAHSRLVLHGALAAGIVLVASCGGGGGGGGGSLPPLNYSGNTNAAVLSATNASQFVSGIFGSSETAEAIVTASATEQAAAPAFDAGQVGYGRRLTGGARELLQQALQSAGGGRPISAVQIDESQMCDGGGSVRVSGTLSDTTGTGTLSIQFTNCVMDGQSINGQGTFRVDAVDFGTFPPIPTDFTVSFTRVQFRAAGISRDVGGTTRAQLMGLTETVTQSLVTLNNLNGRMTRTDNFVAVTTYDNLLNPTSLNSNYTGRFYDSVHGYVEITPGGAPLHRTSLTQPFPSSGQVTLTGAGNRAVRVTAVSATLATFALDLDGDGNFEGNATVAWLELSSTSGSNLADGDRDGMHDGWEQARGVTDPGMDPDSDGFTNLQEYQAGTDPNNPGSFPLTGPGGGSGSDPAPIAFAGIEVALHGVSDLAYDAVGQMLYASVRAGAGNSGSVVVPINPANGALGTAIPVGIEPAKLAISDNGQYLYVGLIGESSIQRINLAAQAVDLTIALGNSANFQNSPLHAEDIAVVPGSPQSIAVSLVNSCCSPRHEVVAIFDGVNRRANATQNFYGGNVIEFSSSASTLYGYNNETTGYDFYTMAVDASGVAVTNVHDSFNPAGALIEGFGVDMRFNSGRIYSTTGRVIDPVNRAILGTFVLPGGIAAAVAPDTTSTAGRVYFLSNVSGWTIRAYSATSAQPPATIMSVPAASGTASSLVRWGTNGLAFLTSAGQVFVIDSAALVP